jgi:tetratricopeptide (TPR) repeat protein
MTKSTGHFRKWIAVISAMLIALSITAQPINEVIEAFNAGAAEMNAGNFEAAIAGFEVTIEKATALGAEGDEMKLKAEGQIPPIHYRIAMDKYKAKDIAGAITSFENAVAASDQYGNDDIKGKSLRYIPQLYNAVGNSQVKSEDFEGAISSFDKALEYQPDYARAIYGKALVYRKQNDESSMITTMETVIAVGNATGDEKTAAAATKTLKDHYVNNGKISFQAEEYEDAIAYFEKSFKYDDQDPEPYFLITVIHVKQEAPEKVIQASEKYLAFNEDDVDKKARIYFELGNAYMTLVEYEKACEAYSNALIEPYLNTVKHKMENVLNCE